MLVALLVPGRMPREPTESLIPAPFRDSEPGCVEAVLTVNCAPPPASLPRPENTSRDMDSCRSDGREGVRFLRREVTPMMPFPKHRSRSQSAQCSIPLVVRALRRVTLDPVDQVAESDSVHTPPRVGDAEQPQERLRV